MTRALASWPRALTPQLTAHMRLLPSSPFFTCQRWQSSSSSSSNGSSSSTPPAAAAATTAEEQRREVSAASTQPPPSSPPAKRMSITIRSPSQRTQSHRQQQQQQQQWSHAGTSPSSSISTSSSTGAQQQHSFPRAHELRVNSNGQSVGGPAGYHHPIAMRSLSHFTEPVKRIILVRNGRSEANDDVSTYVSTPDWRIPLVEAGKRQCVQSGRRLAELVGDDPVYVYYSPYIRSRQSLRYVLQGYDEGRQGASDRQEWWEASEEEKGDGVDDEEGCMDWTETERSTTADSQQPQQQKQKQQKQLQVPISVSSSSSLARPGAVASASAPVVTPGTLHDSSLILRSGPNNRIIGVREDVRLRDGDIGRYRNTAELIHHLEERERYGKFFYRFPYGESGADVCDRITSFLDAFQRERVEFPMDTNVVVIAHGLTIRMLIKRWFHLTVDTFHCMSSPPSGSIVPLTRLHHRSCFRLDESCVEQMNLPLSLNEHNGYKYRNKRLLGSMSSGAPYM